MIVLSKDRTRSGNDSRPFCFPVPTKTLSYDVCYYHHSSLLSRKPWSLQYII